MKNVILLALVFGNLPLVAQARQHPARVGGKDYVVHSRMAPVVMHRALPPYKGQHVYQGKKDAP